MFVRGRRVSVENGDISTFDRSGNSVLVRGNILGLRIRVDRIEPFGDGIKVFANGRQMDITPSELTDFISFVDTGTPDKIKLLKLSRVVTKADGTMVLEKRSIPWLGLVVLAVGAAGIIYWMRNR